MKSPVIFVLLIIFSYSFADEDVTSQSFPVDLAKECEIEDFLNTTIIPCVFERKYLLTSLEKKTICERTVRFSLGSYQSKIIAGANLSNKNLTFDETLGINEHSKICTPYSDVDSNFDICLESTNIKFNDFILSGNLTASMSVIANESNNKKLIVGLIIVLSITLFICFTVLWIKFGSS